MSELRCDVEGFFNPSPESWELYVALTRLELNEVSVCVCVCVLCCVVRDIGFDGVASLMMSEGFGKPVFFDILQCGFY